MGDNRLFAPTETGLRSATEAGTVGTTNGRVQNPPRYLHIGGFDSASKFEKTNKLSLSQPGDTK